MSSKFRSLFAKKKETVEENFVLNPGDFFPTAHIHEIKENHMIGLITLTCVTCINLLEELRQLEQYYQGTFSLFILGSEDEVKPIVDHFKYTFTVYSIDEHHMFNVYAAQKTPYFYYINEHGRVITSATINHIKDIKEILL